MIVNQGLVLALAAPAVCLGGVIGFATSLPRVLLLDDPWRAETENDPASSALTSAVIVASWPVSGPYPTR